jgi:hypothetical protein
VVDVQKLVSRLAIAVSLTGSSMRASRAQQLELSDGAVYAQSVATGWGLLCLPACLLMIVAGAIGDFIDGQHGRHLGLAIIAGVAAFCVAGLVINLLRTMVGRYRSGSPSPGLTPKNRDLVLYAFAGGIALWAAWPRPI